MRTQRIFGTLDPFIESVGVMGRTVANAAFLDALMRADPFDAYHFFLPSRREQARQEGLLSARYPQVAGRGAFTVLTRQDLPRTLGATDYAVFHLSDCITAQARLAAVRNTLSRSIFPITGGVHSLSYAHYQREFLGHLWPGTTRRDAIVATSTAGREVVAALFDALRRGYGLSPEAFPAPRLALIPLGVEPDQWRRLDGQARQDTRAAYGIAPEATVVLAFGRISHSSKMDLLPFCRAVQRLKMAKFDVSSLVLIAAGWTDEADGADDDYQSKLTGLAANAGLRLLFVRRPSDASKKRLFGLADAFVSLADNPQETFGLTLLEAMAASLPVIASDYDGYRDIVQSGHTGWLLPTTGFPDLPGRDVLAPLCYDNHAHLRLAQATAVSVPALADVLATLLSDPGQARGMGLAGRERAVARFTWDACVGRHLELWEGLAGEPVPDRAALAAVPHPWTLAHGDIFACYPTDRLDDAKQLTWTRTGQAVYRGQEFPVIYKELEGEISEETMKLLMFLARGGCPGRTLARRLAAAVPGLDEAAAVRHVLLAIKQDLLEVRKEPA